MSVASTAPSATSARGRGNEPLWRRPSLVAWLWIGPGGDLRRRLPRLPVIYTIWLSLSERDSTQFVGLDNYRKVFTNASLLEVLRNNMLWLVLGTALTVALGLVIAVLVDRVRIESVAKAAIFIPMAISFVGAGVIWLFVYAYSAPGAPQIGLLNAIFTRFGGQPQAWLTGRRQQLRADRRLRLDVDRLLHGDPLRRAQGHPGRVLEAARMDGATEVQIFFRIIVPMISPTIASSPPR